MDLGPILGGIAILLVVACIAWCVGKLLDLNTRGRGW